MKKIISLAMVCSFFAINAANAQTEEKYYGSEQGGFALTIGADPIINRSTKDFGTSIAGKYFLSDKLALNAELGVKNSSDKDFYYDNPEDEEEVTSTEAEGGREFSIRLGGQYILRPGKRLQPYVGANVYYGRTISKLYHEESFDFSYRDNWGTLYEEYEGFLKTSNPKNTFAVMANIGVEYFLVKNISISATLDLGVSTATTKMVSKFDTDDRDATNEFVEARNYSTKTQKSTKFATGLQSSKIAFNFYF